MVHSVLLLTTGDKLLLAVGDGSALLLTPGLQEAISFEVTSTVLDQIVDAMSPVDDVDSIVSEADLDSFDDDKDVDSIVLPQDVISVG